MRIKTINYASEGTRFHKDAFDKQIKKSIRINLPNGKTTVGVIKGVEVTQDGKAVEFDIEISEKNGKIISQGYNDSNRRTNENQTDNRSP